MGCKDMDRRDVLKLGALGALGIAGLSVPLGQQVLTKSASALADKNFPRPYTRAFERPRVLKPVEMTDERGSFLQYSVTAMPGTAAIVRGLSTPVYGYNGLAPGPVIDMEQGKRAKLRMRNALPAINPLSGETFQTSTHLHGSASLPQFDGYANDVTQMGAYKTYEYPNYQGAKTLWYHDHAVHRTAQNVYSGLAAQCHLHDGYERGQLPQGEFDVPLSISDAMFAADGTLAYDDDDHSGLWGDVVLVNGVPWPKMKVKRRVYRFRILNASISRSYRPALSTGEPLTIVATDGGMVPVAQRVANFRLGNAERYEVLIDFSRYSAGARVNLINLNNQNNVSYTHTNKIMQFEVTDEPFDGTNDGIPSRLDIDPRGRATMELTPAMAKRTTKLRVHRDDVTNAWLINDMTWADVVDSEFTKVVASPDIGDVELWEIENRGGGWFHPVHIHLVDFKVIGRNTNSGQPFAWERGPKDVVYVGEGETVKLLMRFEVGEGSTGGRYMIHCHNLPHEDHDMMVQFQVGDNIVGDDPNDPIRAARPVADDLPPDQPEYEPPVAPPGW